MGVLNRQGRRRNRRDERHRRKNRRGFRRGRREGPSSPRVAREKARRWKNASASCFVRADVSIEADVKAMIDRAVTRFGRAWTAWSTTPAFPRRWSASPDDRRRQHRSGLGDQRARRPPRHATRGAGHAVPGLRQHHQRRQHRRSSRRPRRATSIPPRKAPFSRSRAPSAAELGEKGIRVNSISPGAIVTGIFGKNAGVDGAKADKVAGVCSNRCSLRFSQFRGPAPPTISRARPSISRATVRASSTARTSFVDGGHAAVTRGWSPAVAVRAGRQVHPTRAELSGVICRSSKRSPPSRATEFEPVSRP